MIKKEKIFYEFVGKEGVLEGALRLQEAGAVIDTDRSYRIGAGSYILTWAEGEESSVEKEEPEKEKIQDTSIQLDKEFLDSLKDLEDVAEAKLLLIEYAESLGVAADKFDKRKSLEKLRKTLAGIVSQMK